MSETQDIIEFIVHVPMYDTFITIVVGGTYKEALKRKKVLKIRASSAPEAHGACITTDALDHILYFFKPPSVGLIAHEVLHSMQHVMSAHDCSLSDETEEFYALYMGHVVEEIWEKLYMIGKTSLQSVRQESQLLTNTSQSQD